MSNKELQLVSKIRVVFNTTKIFTRIKPENI